MRAWVIIISLAVLGGCAAAPISDHPRASTPEKQRLGPAPEARPADYSAIRRCQQQALYLLDQYNGPHDGSNSPAWQTAQERYLLSRGMPRDRPLTDG